MREETQVGRKIKKHKRVSKFRYYFINIFLGIIITAIVAVMLIYLLCPVQNVKITGSTLYTDIDIQNYVFTDKYSNNAVYVYLKNKIKPQKNIPFVERVDIKMTGRDSLTIKVTEKDPVGYIATSKGKYAYFDEEGTVIEVSELALDNVMLVQGITCKKASVGQTLDINQTQRKVILSLVRDLKKYQVEVPAVTFHEDMTMTIQYQNIVIELGNRHNLTEKIMRLPYILPQLEGMAGTLHLENWTENSTDIVFKKATQ